MLFGLFDTK